MTTTRIVAGVACLLALASVGFAQPAITVIDVVVDNGGVSVFDAGTGILTYTNSGSARIFASNPMLPGVTLEYVSDESAITMDFLLDNDNSFFQDGQWWLSGAFSTGTWSVDVFDNLWSGGNSPVLHLDGTLDWFSQSEDPADTVRGRGVLNLAQAGLFVENGFGWGGIAPGGMGWGGDGQTVGYRTVETQNSPIPVETYATFLGSDSVSMTFLADASQVPEPMTLALLGVGSLLLRRRR